MSPFTFGQDICKTFLVEDILAETCDSFYIYVLLEMPHAIKNENLPYTFVIVEKKDDRFNFDDSKLIAIGDIITLFLHRINEEKLCFNIRLRNSYISYYRRMKFIENNLLLVDVFQTNDIQNNLIKRNNVKTPY